MPSYHIRFTNGSEGAATVVAQPDLAFAKSKARELARGVMQMPSLGRQDQSKWRIIIESEDEGRFEEAFSVT